MLVYQRVGFDQSTWGKNEVCLKKKVGATDGQSSRMERGTQFSAEAKLGKPICQRCGGTKSHLKLSTLFQQCGPWQVGF